MTDPLTEAERRWLEATKKDMAAGHTDDPRWSNATMRSLLIIIDRLSAPVRAEREALERIAAEWRSRGATCRWCGWGDPLNPTHNDDCPAAIARDALAAPAPVEPREGEDDVLAFLLATQPDAVRESLRLAERDAPEIASALRRFIVSLVPTDAPEEG